MSTRSDGTARIRLTVREAARLVGLVDDQLDRFVPEPEAKELLALRTKLIHAGERALEGVTT